jgi:hypothetical protein
VSGRHRIDAGGRTKEQPMSRSSLGAVLLLCAVRISARAGSPDALDASRRDARALLSRPACRMLLSSYTDAAGRSLAENLRPFDVPAPAYLDLLVFRPAPDDAPACAEPANVFFPPPGSLVVFVCGRRLESLRAADARLASVLVLHEMLHTLGLGENPPSPAQITARVGEHCR